MDIGMCIAVGFKILLVSFPYVIFCELEIKSESIQHFEFFKKREKFLKLATHSSEYKTASKNILASRKVKLVRDDPKF